MVRVCGGQILLDAVGGSRGGNLAHAGNSEGGVSDFRERECEEGIFVGRAEMGHCVVGLDGADVGVSDDFGTEEGGEEVVGAVGADEDQREEVVMDGDMSFAREPERHDGCLWAASMKTLFMTSNQGSQRVGFEMKVPVSMSKRNMVELADTLKSHTKQKELMTSKSQ